MVTGYKNAISSFNRNVRNMLIYYALLSVGNGIIGVLFNLYFLKLGLDENFLGSVVFVQSLSLGLVILPFGMLADRYRKDAMIKAGWFVMSTIFAAVFLARDPRLLIALNGLQSVGLALSASAEYAYLSENVPAETRTHLFAINMAIFTGGPALGSALAGYLPRLFGALVGTAAESAATYRLSLFVAVALYLASGFAVMRLRESPERARRGAVPVGAEGRAAGGRFKLRLKFSNPGAVLGLCLNSAFVGLAASMFVPFQNVIFNQRFAMPAPVIGWLFTAQNLAIAVGSLIAPHLSQRKGNLAGAVMLQCMALGAYVLLALSPTAVFFAAGFLLRGVFANMCAPLIDSFTMESVDAGERGTVNSTLNLFRNVLWGLGGKLGGFFLQEGNYTLPLFMAVGFYSGAVAVFLLMARKTDRAGATGPEKAVPEVAELE